MATLIKRVLSLPCRNEAKVLVTGGASGRLGPRIVDAISDAHHALSTSSRTGTDTLHLPMTSTIENMKTLIKDNVIGCVINSAAISSGTFSEMKDINISGAQKLAQACAELGIPMIQISSTASQANDLSEKQPYAYTKMRAEEAVINHGGHIARVDVLIGDKKSTTIALPHMAGTSLSPVSVRTADRTIQPITYDAAAIGISEMAKALLNNIEIEQVINIAGDPMQLHAFLDMIQADTAHLYVTPEDLRPLANLINNGAFTPEFLDLAERETPVMPTGSLKALIGSDFPQPEQVAAEAKASVSMAQLMKIAKFTMGNKSPAERKAIIVEAMILIKKATIGGNLSTFSKMALRSVTNNLEKSAK
jgi:dTDP-4-dehydrorhamnose reductase